MEAEQIISMVSTAIVALATVSYVLYMAWKQNGVIQASDISHAIDALMGTLNLSSNYAKMVVGWLEQLKKVQGLENSQLKAMAQVKLRELVTEQGLEISDEMIDILV